VQSRALPEPKYQQSQSPSQRTPSTTIRSWTPEEDAKIVQLVKEQGSKKWTNIAMYLNGRTGKQCRERWAHHLDPKITKTAWTAEEDGLIIQAQARHGNKWALISRLLPGRTDNSVKNRWNSNLSKISRHQPTPGSATVTGTPVTGDGRFSSALNPATQRQLLKAVPCLPSLNARSPLKLSPSCARETADQVLFSPGCANALQSAVKSAAAFSEQHFGDSNELADYFEKPSKCEELLSEAVLNRKRAFSDEDLGLETPRVIGSAKKLRVGILRRKVRTTQALH